MYTAESIRDVAEFLYKQAANERKCSEAAATKRDKARHISAAWAYDDSARILRETKFSPTRFWLQTQAPAGNWTDSLGSTKEECERHGKWMIETKSASRVRVIERFDNVVWEG